MTNDVTTNITPSEETLCQTSGWMTVYQTTSMPCQITTVTNVDVATSVVSSNGAGISRFGSTFVGGWWHEMQYTTNICVSSYSKTNTVQGTTQYDVAVNVPVLTNCYTVTNFTTNVEYSISESYGAGGDTGGYYVTNWSTNIDYYGPVLVTQYVPYTTQVYTGQVITVITNTENKIAAGITSIASVPYIGQISPDGSGFFYLVSNVCKRAVEFYIHTIVPTNLPPVIGPSGVNSLPPWHGYHASEYPNWSNTASSAMGGSVFGGGSFKPEGVNQWSFWDSATSGCDVVGGRPIGGNSGNSTTFNWDWMTADYMTNGTSPNLGYYFNQLGVPDGVAMRFNGWEVSDAISVLRWNFTFK